MQQVISISENLYNRLQVTAIENGLPSIEQLLEYWQKREATLKQRQIIVRQIVSIRERLQREFNQFPDSVTLLQEDRSR